MRLARQVPPLERPARVGPCFLVSSGEPGMAGLCQLQVHAQVPGAVQPPLLLEQEVLITDGPTMVAPGTLDAADLAQVSGFELSVKGQPLGVLSLCPAPTATFTSEGGFKPPPDFTWSAAAEEEMNDRLKRLLEGRGKGGVTDAASGNAAQCPHGSRSSPVGSIVIVQAPPVLIGLAIRSSCSTPTCRRKWRSRCRRSSR